MNLKHLLDWSYWFYQPFTAQGGVMWFFVIFFLALVLFGLSAKITRLYQMDKWYKEILRRVGNAGITMGLLGILWLFFRQERVAFLAWRFWLLLWTVCAIIWLVKIVRYLLKRVSTIRQEEQKRSSLNKYLPGKN
jgi:hypothetical protein